jgi:hypothetical protein
MPEGGVWKTTNAGTTWKPIFDDVRVASVGAVAVAPSDPNVVYVGTGNQSGWAFTIGKGVYKSTDAGKTWANVGLSSSQYIGAIVVDPRNANSVLVAALGPRPAGPPGAAAPAQDGSAIERGVYRTDDGGRTWTRVLPADGSAGASDVYLDYADPQMTFALLAGAPVSAGTGAHKSSDGGATWKPIGGRGLPEGARIVAFAVASGTHGRRLYSVMTLGGGRGSPGTGRRALYRSDDGGESWSFGTSALASGAGKMYADPQHPDVVYLMGTAIYRSIADSTSRRSGARRAAPIRAFCGSIRPTRGACSRASIKGPRSRWTAARRGRRTTGSSTASSTASRPTTTSRTTCAARSRTREPHAWRAAATSARYGRTTGIREAASRTDS